MNLTPKQEKFCQEYVKTGNASEAYRRSYDCSKMKSTSVNRKAKEVMDNVNIAARIRDLRAADQKEFKIDRAWIVGQYVDTINKCNQQFDIKPGVRWQEVKSNTVEKLAKTLGLNEPEKLEIGGSNITIQINKSSVNESD